MNEQLDPRTEKIIFIAQILSVSLIWVFVIGITVWILNLIRISIELHDMPGASVGISIVAIPVFITLASILTYVFLGLQKERNRPSNKSEEK
ncbi:MAG: hypothetical protein HW407_1937 [Bacteroidetes bacterium]|nr:hypothetical protein [Bacteroidota bacterium]